MAFDIVSSPTGLQSGVVTDISVSVDYNGQACGYMYNRYNVSIGGTVFYVTCRYSPYFSFSTSIFKVGGVENLYLLKDSDWSKTLFFYKYSTNKAIPVPVPFIFPSGNVAFINGSNIDFYTPDFSGMTLGSSIQTIPTPSPTFWVMPGTFPIYMTDSSWKKGFMYQWTDGKTYMVSDTFAQWTDLPFTEIWTGNVLPLGIFTNNDVVFARQTLGSGSVYEKIGGNKPAIEMSTNYVLKSFNTFQNPVAYFTESNGWVVKWDMNCKTSGYDSCRLNGGIFKCTNNAGVLSPGWELCGGVLSSASCSDGIKNQDETWIDVGWVCGTCLDGIKNGNETGSDFWGRCGTNTPTTWAPSLPWTCPANQYCTANIPWSIQLSSTTSANTSAAREQNIGDPITLSTGESIYSNTFLHNPGIGLSYEFSLTNRTQASYNGPVGFGWDHNYNIFLKEWEDSSVSLYNGQLGISPFPKNTDGTFVKNASSKATLSKNSDGLYDLIFDSGLVYHFWANLRIATMVDANENTLIFSYDTDNKLTKVTDTLGKDIIYTYDTDARLTTVTDSTGRHVDLAYFTSGVPEGSTNDLKSVTTTNADNAEKTVSYTYTKVDGDAKLSHNIKTLIDAKDQVYVENTYDINDRITAQKYGDGILAYVYTMDSTNTFVQKTVATNKRGIVSEYTYDQYGNELSMKVKNASKSTLYSSLYNEKGQKISETKPLGNGTAFKYDDRGNIIERRLKTNMSRVDNDDTDIVTKYTFESTYNNLTETIAPDGTKTDFTYDNKGNLTKAETDDVHINAIDTKNIIIENKYNSKGQITKTTDAEDNITTYEYNEQWLPTKVTKGIKYGLIFDDSSNATVTTYTYDSHGNPLTVMDGEGNIQTLTYDAFDALKSSLTPEGVQKNFVYNANNKLEKSETILDATTKLTETTSYDVLDEVTGSTVGSSDTDKRIMSVTRDLNGNIATTTDARGLMTKYVYDEFEKVTEIRLVIDTNDSSKDIVTKYAYDANGNKIKITDAKGNVTTFSYDTYDRAVSSTDAHGTVTSYVYDKVGNITATTVIDKNNTVLSRAATTYNELGKTLTQSIIDPKNNTPRTLKFSYDKNGNILTKTDALGNVTVSVYDSRNQLIESADILWNKITLVYDKRGLVTSKTITGSDGTNLTTAYVYDKDGRKTKETNAKEQNKIFTYNKLGQVVETTDEAGNKTRYTYDVFGNVLSESKYPNNQAVATTYTYDKGNNLVNLTDSNGNKTSYEYDILGRKTKETLPDGAYTTFTYDINGNILTQTDPNGTTISNTYDSLNRLINRSIQTGTWVVWVTSETYTYDSLGHLTSGNDSQSGSLVFSYDAFGQLTTESSSHIIRNSQPASVSYAYDQNGNRTSITSWAGYSTNYIYDALDRLTKVGFNNANIANYNYVGTDLTNVAYANNASTAYSYDTLKRLQGMARTGINMGSGTALTTDFDRAFTYDAVGNILSDGTRKYTYDTLSRVNQALYSSVTTASGKTTEKWETWAYDGLGSRTNATRYTAVTQPVSLCTIVNKVKTCTLQPKTTTSLATNNSYSGNILNQYLSITNTGTTNTGTTSYIYDKNGNLVNDGVSNYSYDYRNRLIEARNINATGSLVSYTYDILGRRTSKTTATTRIDYLYAWDNAIQEITTSLKTRSSKTTDYIYGNWIDDLIAYNTDVASVAGSVDDQYDFCITRVLPYKDDFIKYGGGTIATKCTDLQTKYDNMPKQLFYIVKDQIGSTIALMNSSGSAVQSYTYDAYGTPYIRTTASGSYSPLKTIKGISRLFTGREYDSEIGMYYYRARYYDPELGRFISRDPIGMRDDVNLYGYVGENPVRFTDPMGKEKKTLSKKYDITHLIVDIFNLAKDQAHNSMIVFEENTRNSWAFDVKRNPIVAKNATNNNWIVYFNWIAVEPSNLWNLLAGFNMENNYVPHSIIKDYFMDVEIENAQKDGYWVNADKIAAADEYTDSIWYDAGEQMYDSYDGAYENNDYAKKVEIISKALNNNTTEYYRRSRMESTTRNCYTH